MGTMTTLSRPAKPEQVLICECERHIARLIQVNLERQGYEVTCVFSGIEALSMLQRHSFDRVILALDTPGISGIDVLKWIRQNEATRGAWVTVLSERESDHTSMTAAPYWANKTLEKPFNPIDLFE